MRDSFIQPSLQQKGERFMINMGERWKNFGLFKITNNPSSALSSSKKKLGNFQSIYRNFSKNKEKYLKNEKFYRKNLKIIEKFEGVESSSSFLFSKFHRPYHIYQFPKLYRKSCSFFILLCPSFMILTQHKRKCGLPLT